LLAIANTSSCDPRKGVFTNFYAKHPSWPPQVETRGNDGPFIPQYTDLSTATRDMSAPTYDNGVGPLNLQQAGGPGQVTQVTILRLRY
jgi:hypothetical protein